MSSATYGRRLNTDEWSTSKAQPACAIERRQSDHSLLLSHPTSATSCTNRMHCSLRRMHRMRPKSQQYGSYAPTRQRLLKTPDLARPGRRSWTDQAGLRIIINPKNIDPQQT